MDNPVCKKVISLFSAFLEHKLGEEDRLFVENHILNCKSCRDKLFEMREIMKNLHFEYEKLINELDREEEKRFNRRREYELFRRNISSYIDNELNYDESVNFRKRLLKSKSARAELSDAYNLRNEIKNSVSNYKNKLNINYSKKIINKIKSENRKGFDYLYSKTVVVSAAIILFVVCAFAFLVFKYFKSEHIADLPEQNFAAEFYPEQEEEMVEFYFDENGEALLMYK